MKPTTRELELVIKRVAGIYGYSLKEIRSRNRQADLVAVRQMLQWLIYNNTELSLTDTGRLFRRDHSSVLNSLAAFGKQTGELKEEAERMQQLWMEGFEPPPRPVIVRQVVVEETEQQRVARIMRNVDYSAHNIVERRRDPAMRRTV